MPLFIPTLIFAISLSLLPSTEPVPTDEDYLKEEHGAYLEAKRCHQEQRNKMKGLGLGLNEQWEERRVASAPSVTPRSSDGVTRSVQLPKRTKGHEAEDGTAQRQLAVALKRRESVTRRRCTSMPPIPCTYASSWTDSTSPTLSMSSQSSPTPITP